MDVRIPASPCCSRDRSGLACNEREEDEAFYTVCKVTFGAEPSGAEVYAFLCTHWHSLRFGPAVAAGPRRRKRRASSVHAGRPPRRRRPAWAKSPAGAGRPARTAGRAEPDTGQALPRGMRSAPFCASPAKRREKHRGISLLCFSLRGLCIKACAPGLLPCKHPQLVFIALHKIADVVRPRATMVWALGLQLRRWACTPPGYLGFSSFAFRARQ